MDSPTTHTDSISKVDSRDAAAFSGLLWANHNYLQYTLNWGVPDLADAATKQGMTDEPTLAYELVSQCGPSQDRVVSEGAGAGRSEHELTVLPREPIADLMRSGPAGGD